MIEEGVWPDWTGDFPSWPEYVCAFPTSDKTYAVPSQGTTLINVEALVDIVRPSGDDDLPWIVYRYAVKLEDGQAFMTGPIKDIPGGHYPKNITPWKIRPTGK